MSNSRNVTFIKDKKDRKRLHCVNCLLYGRFMLAKEQCIFLRKNTVGVSSKKLPAGNMGPAQLGLTICLLIYRLGMSLLRKSGPSQTIHTFKPWWPTWVAIFEALFYFITRDFGLKSHKMG